MIAITTLVPESLAAMTRRVTLRGALLLDAAVTGANGAAYLLAAGRRSGARRRYCPC